MNYELVKYRDAGLMTYTYFWMDENRTVISPYFDSNEEAIAWLEERWNENE